MVTYAVCMPSDLRRLAALEEGGTPAAAPADAPMVRTGRPVPDGPVANRRAVRRYGAFAALLAPAVAGGIGALLLWGSDTAWRGVPGFTLLVAAAPIMPLAGVPASGGSDRYLIAGVLSAVLWMVIGFVASRRATRMPIATWYDWRTEYIRLALGASLGGLAAVGAWLLALRYGWA
jgi:hypothetical protein